MFRIYLSFLTLLFKNDLAFVNAANILGLMPVPSPSHHLWNSVLMHRLGELGHNVTVLSVDLPKPNEKIPPNVHYIYLEEVYNSLYKSEDKIDITDSIGIGPFKTIQMFYDNSLSVGLGIVKSKGLQTLLDYPKDFKFDVIIHDYTMGPFLLGFLHRFNYPPLVGMSAFLNPPNTIDQMSNHYFPAYVPYHSTDYSPEMSFIERLTNTLLFIFDTAYRRLIFLPKIDSAMRPYFPKDTPYLGELSKRTTLSLVNSHPATNYVEPLPPNVIEVGGMQILDPKPLPDDLAAFFNNSKNGVVFISFGTNMKSEDFTEDQIRVIVNAMKSLPEYDFMWKFDAKYLKEKLPKNAIIRSFFPQRDILAHPKLKGFVTHCGGLSTHESIWRGVPMIGVPLYFDQRRNLQNSLLAGTAVKLDFLTLTAEVLSKAIKNVVEDPKIRANAIAKGTQYRDRPMKALDTAVWWVEYLLRNPNPYHLKSPAEKLNIFQAVSLDCLLVILIALGLAIYIPLKLVLMVLKKSRGEKKSNGNSKKVKKN